MWDVIQFGIEYYMICQYVKKIMSIILMGIWDNSSIQFFNIIHRNAIVVCYYNNILNRGVISKTEKQKKCRIKTSSCSKNCPVFSLLPMAK